MPTYCSTGIGASLVVTELASTLSDEIIFRMGHSQREEAERIKSQLLNGRKLQERPFGQNNDTVGVLNFVGIERDMALFAVEASEPEQVQVQDEYWDYSLTNVDFPPVTASAFTSLSPTGPDLTTMGEPAQVGASREKKKKEEEEEEEEKDGDNERSSTHNQSALTTPTLRQKRSQRRITFGEPLALSLKLDCEDFLKSDDMHRKELKIEVFLNGQLVDVTFENQRQAKSKGKYVYSGKRFHRQAEKPWIYAPGAASSNTGDLMTERWTKICRALDEEASQRGIHQTGQRPLSAQFLIALARLQLPDTIGERSGNFAVFDVIITAGKGRKYGAETSYITAPTRLLDASFGGIAPVDDDYGQHPDPYEYLQDAFVHMPCRDLGVSNFTSSDFLNAQIQPSALMGIQFPIYPEQQMPPPPSPRTPKPNYKSTQTYRKALERMPIQKLLSNYENARGHIKGRRTLKQRLGDMSKMSPRKRMEVMNELKEELDEKTMDTVKQAFETDCHDLATPTNEKVPFSSHIFDSHPMSDNDDADIFGQPTNTIDAVGPYNLAYDIPPPQPRCLVYSSGSSQMPISLAETEPFQQTMMPPYPAQRFAQSYLQPSPIQMFPPGQQATMKPFSTQSSIPPITPPKKTPACALSNSPVYTPVKKWPSQLRAEALAALGDDEEEDNVRQPSFPVSGAPTTPHAQRVGKGSKRNSGAWLPKEQKSEQALRDFEIPDLCVGSTVSYAGGLQQRQVTKARGGEFEEQQFVVGMRFVVL